MRRSLTQMVAWLGYGLVLVLIAVGMARTRSIVQHRYATSEARDEWQIWRSEAARDATNAGTVQRRIPRSNLPPAMVLFTKYYSVCLTGAVVISSALYWTAVWMVYGALFGPRRNMQES